MVKEVKVTISSTAKGDGLKKTEKGADRAAAAVDKLDRSTKRANKTARKQGAGLDAVDKKGKFSTRTQNRLANETANASRSFSAQASGLGGLVAAYAGAAATIFALTAAFSILNRAAVAEQTIEGTRALGASIGESGDVILATIQKITKAQLTLVEAAENINIALSSGFNISQIEALSEVSLRASKALGRNLVDAFQRLVRGTAKLEPELLDELGIFVRIEPAVQKYAAQIGKAATQLTNFERRQAFVNATIEEGQRKFATVDISASTSAESLQQLSAAVLDVGREIGGFIANFIKPFIDFIGGSFTNIIAVVAVLGITIFGKALNLASGAIGNFGQKRLVTANANLEKFLDTTTRGKKVVEGFTKAIKEVNTANLKGSKASTAATRDLTALGKAGQLSGAQAQQLAADYGNQASLAKEAAAQSQSQANKLSALGKQTPKTTKRIAEYNAEVIKQNKAAERFSKGQAGISKALKDVDPKLLKAQQKATRFAGGLNKVTGIAAGVISKITLIAVAVSFLTIGFNLLTDVLDIREEVGAFISDSSAFILSLLGIGAASREVSDGLKGISEGLVNLELGKVFKNIPKEFAIQKNFLGFTFESTRNLQQIQKLLRKITDPKERIILLVSKEELNRIKEAGKQFRTIRTDPATGKAVINIAAKDVNLVDRLNIALDKLKNNLRFTTAEGIKAGFALEKALRQQIRIAPVAAQIASLSSDVGIPIAELASKLDVAVKSVNGMEVAFFSIRDAQDSLFKGIRFGIRSISELTKVSKENATQALIDAKTNEQAAAKTIGGRRISAFIGEGDDRRIKERRSFIQEVIKGSIEEQRVRTRLTAALIKAVDLEKELKVGRISAEGISSRILAIDTAINKVRDKGLKLLDKQGLLNFKNLVRSRQLLKIQADRQIAIEQETTALRRVFSSQISASTNLFGFFDKNLKIAFETTEVRKNEVVRLGQILDQTKEAVKLNEKQAILGKEKVKIEGADLKLVTLGLAANAALLGLFIKTRQEVKKLNAELLKRITALDTQEQLINQQTFIKFLQLRLRLEQISIQNRQKEINAAKNFRDIELQIFKERQKQIKIETESRAKLFQVAVTGPAAGLFTDDFRRGLEIKFAEADLRRLEELTNRQIEAAIVNTNAQQKLIKEQIASEKRQNVIRKQVIDATAAAERIRAKGQAERIRQEAERIVEQGNILIEQAEIFKGHIAGLAKVLAADIINRARGSAEGVVGFAKRTNLINIRKEETVEEFARRAVKALGERFTKDIKEREDELNKRLILLGIRLGIFSEQALATATAIEKAAGATATFQKRIADVASKGKLKELADQSLLLEKQLDNRIRVLKNNVKERKQLLEQLKEIARLERSVVLKAFIGIIEGINEGIESAVERIRKSFLEDGKLDFAEGAREIANTFVDNISKNITKALIVQPLQELVTKTLGGTLAKILGLDKPKPTGTPTDPINVRVEGFVPGSNFLNQGTKGITGINTFPVNTPLANIFPVGPRSTGGFIDSDGNIDALFESFDENAAGSLGEGGTVPTLFNGVFAEGGLISFLIGPNSFIQRGFKALFGEGGLFSAIFDNLKKIINDLLSGSSGGGSGIGSLFSGSGSIFSSIGGVGGGAAGGAAASLPGLASGFTSGGTVRNFASGGLNTRDSIFARLEPGEFVVRKQAAQRIGLPTLQNMNRGNSGGNIPIVFNVTNSGSEKEVDEQESGARFDAGKMIIDVVLKDLKANGPIRQGIRGMK